MTSEQLKQETQPDGRIMMDVIAGLLGYPTVLVAHHLGLFPLLKHTPLSLDDISAELKISRRSASAMLNVNVAMRLLERDGDRFHLTPHAEAFLLPESQTYFGDFLNMILRKPDVIALDTVKEAIQSGKSQFYQGKDMFDEHLVDSAKAQMFTRAMHGSSMGPALHWPDMINLAKNSTMLDIGGASGAHSIGAITRWNNLKAIVFDMPPVCEVADEYIVKLNMQQRIVTHPANIWKDDFPQADLHFYSQIFHDFNDDDCRFLAHKSFASLPSGGRIILHEVLMNDDLDGPFAAAASCVGMLISTDGRQFSAHELSQMLQEAGFIDIQAQKTGYGYWSIVSAIKP